MDFESLFPHPVLLISGVILGILWAVTKVKIKGKKLSESKVWTGLRPVVALALGVGAALIPGAFSDDVSTGQRVLLGIWAGFMGALWYLGGIATAILKLVKGKVAAKPGGEE